MFKVSTDGAPSVVNIVHPSHSKNERQIPCGQPRSSGSSPPPHPPCLYFMRELDSHRRLVTADLAGTLTPRVHGVLQISAAHEALLLSEGKLPCMRRRKSAQMPLTAVWMELITGGAIGDGRHGGRGGEGAETACGGGARECAYCRGREVVGEGERAVWLDFSNAAVADAGGRRGRRAQRRRWTRCGGWWGGHRFSPAGGRLWLDRDSHSHSHFSTEPRSTVRATRAPMHAHPAILPPAETKEPDCPAK